MRMDRYEEEKNGVDSKPSRLNKNQELYTDVYLNNVYVDINNIKDVVAKEDEEKEVLKVAPEPIDIDYTYEEKNYDIVKIVEEAINNQEEDQSKRSIDLDSNNEKIDNLIESINEKVQEEQKEQEQDGLLSDLLPENENTEVIPPLEEPILDTSVYREPVLVLPDEEETEEYELLTDDIKESDLEEDSTFVLKKGNKRIKLIIILGFLLVMIAVVVILKLLDVF